MNAQAQPGWAARVPWRWTRRGASGAAAAHWGQEDDRAVLRLSGDWRQKVLPTPRPAPAAPPGPLLPPLRVDGSAISASDERLGPWLWPLAQAAVAAGREVQLHGLPPRQQALLGVALEQARRDARHDARQDVQPGPAAAGATEADPAAVAPPAGSLTRMLHGVGARARLALQDRVQTLGFIGSVLQAAVAGVPGPARNRLRRRLHVDEVLAQFEQAGPRSLPIVLLVGGLIGLILAYMGGAQLRLFGAQSFVAPLVAVGELREIAALAVGIVLAGRVGAAYAAQLATMRGSEEIDALRVMGVDPVQHLVLPRLAALLVAAPLLTVMAAACGMAAGWAVAVGVHGVAPREYLQRSVEAMTLAHLLVGLFKGTLYGVLVGLAGCRQGLHAERSAQGVGAATTQAVVQGIVWVTVAASLTTVLFEQLGW
jgi:phospholipid/cholesterol/gamma-HCH transport system permease protein